jgi:hypothetical protein
MILNDFTVEMISESNPGAIKKLTVISVNEASKTLVVSFLGGSVGRYTFKINGAAGYLDCPSDKIFIETMFEVTDFQPKKGSTLGGTLITITGRHFGSVYTDNPVKIGNNYCHVLTTADTRITCRIGNLANSN